MTPSEKIKSLADLADILDNKRSSQPLTVAHCHGVFDLLHIGHIRHFEEAKEMADILVVTITPDHYVNKGPHRPAFTDTLRAEAIAALDCADFVAINEWPTALETIKILRPSFYVKGADYKQLDSDYTGGIKLEKEAVGSVGGELRFTDDITFSSTNLINQHIPTLPNESRQYLDDFAQRFALNEIFEYLEHARELRVLVLGETIVDEYQYCEAIGKSSKEPTLVVKAQSCEKFAGGIAAIANHIANFVDNVTMLSYLGTITPQKTFIDENLNQNIERVFLDKTDSPTIVKRRFVDHYFFTKLLEVYEINDDNLTSDDNERLCSYLRENIDSFDLVVVADFGHGMISREAIDILCSKARFLALNVQANAGNKGYHTLSTYPRADFISTAEAEMRLESRDRHGDLKSMITTISEKMNCPRIIVTRGSQGCLAYDKAAGFFEVPALAQKVVDRVGAGDAFLSVAALYARNNAPIELIGFIGNAIGALAVATVCNRQSVDNIALRKQVESLLK